MPTAARGRKAQVLMFFESVYNESPGVITGVKLPVVSSEIVASQSLQQEDVIRNSRNPLPSGRGFNDVQGPVTVPVDELGIGYWLTAMFGDPTTTEVTAGVLYSHVWKLTDALKSIGIEQGFTDKGKYFLYNGCKVSKFTIEFGGEGNLNATIDIVGGKETPSSASVDVDALEVELYRFNNFQGTIQEAGVDIAVITKFKIEIDFDLDTGENTYPIGNEGYRSDLPEGIAKISGSMTAMYHDDTLRAKSADGTETSIKTSLIKGTKELHFFMPEVQLERTSPGIKGSKGVMLELNYEAYENGNAEGTAIVVTLKNSQESY